MEHDVIMSSMASSTYYGLSNNLLFCGYEVIMSNYDETYCVIYEVIMRKFRASMEPFWDLKFSEVCRVSCACIQRIPYKRHVAFSGEQRRPNFTHSLG